jgi:uncharacterized protein (DUF427 family)
MWNNTGQSRPDFAIAPGPGQESVWDYPRPPALVDCAQAVEIRAGDVVLARSSRAKRLLETASPPTVYVPADDVALDRLRPAPGSSFCEWKGVASYWGLADAPDAPPVAWSYEDPTPRFAAIRGWIAFYPGRVACFLDGERVRPQEGGFYGGWVTDAIVGPWKGQRGTGHW